MPEELGPNSTDVEKALEYYRVKPNESKIQSDSAAERFLRKLWSLSGANDPSSAILSPMPLDFSLQKPANSFIAKIVNRIINSRNEVYHATGLQEAANILNSGEIQPTISKYERNPGVSVSRIPNISTFQSSPVRLILDQSKLPENKSLAERIFSKTFTNKFNHETMEPEFEFENRTVGKPISVGAIKKVLVQQYPKNSPADFYKTILENRANLGSIPTETFESSRELNSYRARRAWDDYYKLKTPAQEFFMNLFRKSPSAVMDTE